MHTISMRITYHGRQIPVTRVGRSWFAGIGQIPFLVFCFVTAFVCCLAHVQAQTSPFSWYWQNPLPQGNSLRAISVVRGNVTYAVGDLGTILRTNDGGASWTLLKSLTTVACRSVWFTDENNGVVVGDAGTVLGTSDGGASWSIRQIDTSINFNGVSFADAKNGTIIGESGALYRTKDGGNTWAPQIGVPLVSLYGIFYSDASHGTLVGASGSIFRTVNGGSTWTRQNSGLENTLTRLLSVSFVDANNGAIAGDVGTVLHTTDGGATWTAQSSGTPFTLNAVCFTDMNVGTVVGDVGQIFHTTNGGASWSLQAYGLTSWFSAVRFTNPNIGIVLGNNGSIFQSTDGGTTWTSKSKTLVPLCGVGFADTSRGIVVGYYGTILTTNDGGRNWSSQMSGTNESLRGISFSSATSAVTVGDNNTILRTVDGGNTWGDRSIHPARNTAFQLNAVAINRAGHGIAVGRYDSSASSKCSAIYTSDGGTSWAATFPAIIGKSLTSVIFIDTETAVAVGESGSIIQSTDAGRTWVSQQSHTSSRLRGISFAGRNSGIVVGDSGTVGRTTDGGTTWNVQRVGRRSLYSVSLFDRDRGFVVASGGTILYTSSGGISWDSLWTRTANALYGSFLSGVSDSGSFSGSNAVNCKGTIVGEAGTILRISYGSLPTGIVDKHGSSIPLEFHLSQNYPNPFNGTTNFEVRLPAQWTGNINSENVSLKVFDLLGRELATLVNVGLSPGIYKIRWNPTDLPSGVYFCRLKAGDLVQFRKVLLLK